MASRTYDQHNLDSDREWNPYDCHTRIERYNVRKIGLTSRNIFYKNRNSIQYPFKLIVYYYCLFYPILIKAPAFSP